MRYGLHDAGALLAWRDDPAETVVLMEDVRQLHAGLTGLLVIRSDDSFWEIDTRGLPRIGEIGFEDPRHVSDSMLTRRSVPSRHRPRGFRAASGRA